MIYKTHEVAGALAVEWVIAETHAPLVWWTPIPILAAGAVAIVADIDEPESWVARRIPVLGQIVGRVIRHRTVTHSIPFIALLWLVVDKLMYVRLPFEIPWHTFALAVVIGYASHPLIDLLNPQGVQLLWPLPYWIKVLPDVIAIPVESPAEDLFRLVLKMVFCLVAVTLLVLHLHLPRELDGVRRLALVIDQIITFS